MQIIDFYLIYTYVEKNDDDGLMVAYMVEICGCMIKKNILKLT